MAFSPSRDLTNLNLYGSLWGEPVSSLSISVNMPIGAAHPSVLGLVSHGLISSNSAAGGGDGLGGLQQGLGPLCPTLTWAGCGHSSSWASAAASCAQELLGQAQLVGAARQMCFGHFTALRVDLFFLWMVGRHTSELLAWGQSASTEAESQKFNEAVSPMLPNIPQLLGCFCVMPLSKEISHFPSASSPRWTPQVPAMGSMGWTVKPGQATEGKGPQWRCEDLTLVPSFLRPFLFYSSLQAPEGALWKLGWDSVSKSP